MPRERFSLDASDVSALLSDEPPRHKSRRKLDPNAPKRARTGFLHFQEARRAQLKAEADPSAPPPSFVEASRRLAAEWKALSASEREPYEQTAREDRARYEAAKATYVPPPVNGAATTKCGRLRKDVLRPKHPRSAYDYFLQASRGAYLEKSPRITVPELTCALAAAWRELDAAGREPYVQQAARDRERFERELAAYTPSVDYVAMRELHQRHRQMKQQHERLPAGGAGCAAAGAATSMTHATSMSLVVSDAGSLEVGELRKELGEYRQENAELRRRLLQLENALLPPERQSVGAGSIVVAPHPQISGKRLAPPGKRRARGVVSDGSLPAKKRGRPVGSKNRPKQTGAGAGMAGAGMAARAGIVSIGGIEHGYYRGLATKGGKPRFRGRLAGEGGKALAAEEEAEEDEAAAQLMALEALISTSGGNGDDH